MGARDWDSVLELIKIQRMYENPSNVLCSLQKWCICIEMTANSKLAILLC